VGKGKKKKKNSRAIDAAAAAEEETVAFPAGVYLSASIHLQSNITLFP